MPPPPSPLRFAALAMGTRFEVLIHPSDPARLPSGRAAAEDALAEIRHWHDRLSRFESSSFLSHLHRRAALEPVPADEDLAALLALCHDVSARSRGAFDPTFPSPPPAHGMSAVFLSRDPSSRPTIRFSAPSLRLDLGAVAKGFALDRAALILRDAGITSALIHGGTSSALAIGPTPPHHPFLIQLANPPHLHADALPAPRIHLQDLALGVSAHHGRISLDPSGHPSGHILNPRTGRPALNPDSTPPALVAAVAGPSAALADAWSTALLVDPSLRDQLPSGYHAAILLTDPACPDRPRWDLGPSGSPFARGPFA